MGKPVAKKAKVETPSFDPKVVEAIQAKEEAIKASLEEEAERLNEIKAEFRKKRVPLFNDRNAVIKTLPGFWKQAINNHSISNILSEEDIKLLNYITDFEVITEDGYKIIFKFKENPIFTNTELVKEYKIVHKEKKEECCKEKKEGCCKDKCCGGGCCCEDEDGDEEIVVPFKVQWKNPAAHDIKKMDNVPFSLFAWFDSEISENSDFPDNILIEGLSDLYLKAVGYFQGTESSVEFEQALCEMMDDDEEEEDDEDDEDDDEDDE